MTDLKCMYCAENGITNTDVFIEIVDVELGAGWICKECFLESEKEKDEHLKELEEQLQAKEQECERLKNERTVDLVKQLDQLKAENEELKKWLPITTRLVDEFENYEKIKGINYRIYTQVFFKKFNKLKQTLTEIKEIAHKINDECELEGFGSCALKYKEQILQKISEVEE